MLARELLERLPRVLPRPVVDLLAQPVGLGDLELDLGDHAERTDRDLCGVQQVAVRCSRRRRRSR